jgi:hypothetical protein
LARSFVGLLLREADLAHSFAQLNGTWVTLERRPQCVDGSIGCLILEEEFYVEQYRVNFAGMLRL